MQPELSIQYCGGIFCRKSCKRTNLCILLDIPNEIDIVGFCFCEMIFGVSNDVNGRANQVVSAGKAHRLEFEPARGGLTFEG